jgi:hypothetical protein
VKVNSHWTIERGGFVKCFLDQFDESIAKYESLYTIASRNDFTAPKLLDSDRNKNTARFEYINGLTSIREAYIEFMIASHVYEEKLDLFRKVGAVLGVIHSEMKLESQDSWDPPTLIEAITRRWLGEENYLKLYDTPHAFLHGDYGFSNVNTFGSSGLTSFAIIDPCPNYYFTFRVNLYASVYIDLATFLSCLDGRVSIRHYRSFQWDRLNLVKQAFVYGYENRAGYKINQCLLAQLTCAITESYFFRKYGNGFRSFIANRLIHNARKKNLPESYC